MSPFSFTSKCFICPLSFSLSPSFARVTNVREKLRNIRRTNIASIQRFWNLCWVRNKMRRKRWNVYQFLWKYLPFDAEGLFGLPRRCDNFIFGPSRFKTLSLRWGLPEFRGPLENPASLLCGYGFDLLRLVLDVTERCDVSTDIKGSGDATESRSSLLRRRDSSGSWTLFELWWRDGMSSRSWRDGLGLRFRSLSICVPEADRCSADPTGLGSDDDKETASTFASTAWASLTLL